MPYYMRYTLQHPRSEAAERLIVHLSPADTEDDYLASSSCRVLTNSERGDLCVFRFLEKDLQGDHYESHFSRARFVWNSSSGITPPTEAHPPD